MHQFFKSSDELKAVKRGRNVDNDYPWAELPVGESFTVVKNRIKLASLRTLASRMSKKLKRRFRVFEHADVYEVGRLEDKPVKTVQEQGPRTWHGMTSDEIIKK